MQITPSDRENMNRAIEDITTVLGKTFMGSRAELQSRYSLSAQFVNMAIARAALTAASGAWAAALDLGQRAVGDIFEELDEVLIKRLD
jgi:hypothetical protein